MKWFQKWKERKQLKQRQSTRQLMGVRKVLPHGVAVSGGCLVFFLIHPNNLSVLSAEGIRQRVTALSNLFRAEEQVEVLALDSRVSFQKNQAYYQTRLEEETTPKIRELLQKDIAHLDAIQATSASSREFVLVLESARCIVDLYVAWRSRPPWTRAACGRKRRPCVTTVSLCAWRKSKT